MSHCLESDKRTRRVVVVFPNPPLLGDVTRHGAGPVVFFPGREGGVGNKSRWSGGNKKGGLERRREAGFVPTTYHVSSYSRQLCCLVLDMQESGATMLAYMLLSVFPEVVVVKILRAVSCRVGTHKSVAKRYQETRSASSHLGLLRLSPHLRSRQDAMSRQKEAAYYLTSMLSHGRTEKKRDTTREDKT